MLLREWRKREGLSQKALAKIVGTYQPMICRIERGGKAPLWLGIALIWITKGEVRIETTDGPAKRKG